MPRDFTYHHFYCLVPRTINPSLLSEVNASAKSLLGMTDVSRYVIPDSVLCPTAQPIPEDERLKLYMFFPPGRGTMLPVVTQSVWFSTKRPAPSIVIESGINVYKPDRPSNDQVPIAAAAVAGVSYSVL